MIQVPEFLTELSAKQLRELLGRVMDDLEHARGSLRHKQAIIHKLAHENAVLKRLKFATTQFERFDPAQRSLLKEDLDADLQAVAEELDQLAPPAADKGQTQQQPKRRPLPDTCPGARSATSPTPLPPAVAACSSASAKTSARSSTTSRACSRSSATSAASGPARAARRSRSRPSRST